MEFYIRETEHPDGPYDLMAVIRKIRNGGVEAETLISREFDGEAVPAKSVKELATFFEERENGAASTGPARVKSFGALINIGMDFLRNSIGATIFTGLFMIMWLGIGYAFIFRGGVMDAMLGIAINYFLLGAYMFGVMRFVRGNPVDAKLVIGKMKTAFLPMAIVSIVVGMLMLPGLVLTHYVLDETGLLLSLPLQFIFLFVVLTFFFFAPLLIVEKNYDFWDALRESVKKVRMGNNMGIVFALVTLNFILLPLMPIVLPVTMGALVELYDEYFY